MNIRKVKSVTVKSLTSAATLAVMASFSLAPVAYADECQLQGGTTGGANSGASTDNLACGSNANATGQSSTAVGSAAFAPESGSTAFGQDARAQNGGSTAVGKSSRAAERFATAVGQNANAMGEASVAIGRASKAIRVDATAVGEDSSATFPRATALGKAANAAGTDSTALGRLAQTTAAATAVGESASAMGGNAVALGHSANAAGERSTALGTSARAPKDDATAVGHLAEADGPFATALGKQAFAIGALSVSIGHLAKAEGDNSIAIGSDSSDLGEHIGAEAIGVKSIVIGVEAKDNAFDGAIVIGEKASASKANQTVLRSEDIFTILDNGNLGLGTSSPTSHLQVSGTGVQLLDVESTNDGPVQVRLKTDSGNRRLVALDMSGTVESQIQLANNSIIFAGNSAGANKWATIDATGITTNGPLCSGGCDAVFDSDYDLPSIEEHAAQMFAYKYLPAIGPTKPLEPINLTERYGNLLNELEKAHIYIAQQEEKIKKQEAKHAQYEVRFERLETLLE